MMVQAHKLAAKAFSDEVPGFVNLSDMKCASEMTAGLESCLQALRELQDTLAIFSNINMAC